MAITVRETAVVTMHGTMGEWRDLLQTLVGFDSPVLTRLADEIEGYLAPPVMATDYVSLDDVLKEGDPDCDHDWQEGVVEDTHGRVTPAEPPYDFCIKCGQRRD
jgi:hypothetical protein